MHQDTKLARLIAVSKRIFKRINRDSAQPSIIEGKPMWQYSNYQQYVTKVSLHGLWIKSNK